MSYSHEAEFHFTLNQYTGLLGRGKTFAAPLPWSWDTASLPNTTIPIPLQDNASGVLVTRTITYTYDSLNRLTAAHYSTGESYGYQYDALGNRTVMTNSTGTTTYTYDDANRLTSVNGVPYTWDQRGNLIHDGVYTYTYNAAGRMMRAASVTATMVYMYNADGLLVARSLNSTLSTFVWDLAAGLPVVISDSATAYLRTFDGKLLAEHRDGIWEYPLADSLGNVRQWSSEAGRVVGYVAYDPFGMQSRREGEVSSPYGYTGEYHDDESALIYLRARYYAPGVGRFPQLDPWEGDPERPQSLNRYVYVENNAVNWTDPSGLCTTCQQGSVVTIGGTGGLGLAARAGPSLDARVLTRLADGAKVVIAEDTPVAGSGLWWHSTFLSRFSEIIAINYGRVWLANQYLMDAAGPPAPPNPGSPPTIPPGSSADWRLPLDEPINYTSGYGYYDWATNRDGTWTCRPEQRVLEYAGCQAGILCLHNGWDMTSGTSTNVYAMGDGVIFEEVKDSKGVIYLLKVLHNVNGQEVEVQYTHIDPAAGLTLNSTVYAGEEIGEYGAFGYDISWPHLHLSFKRGKYGPLADPASYWQAGQPPVSFSHGNPILPGP